MAFKLLARLGLRFASHGAAPLHSEGLPLDASALRRAAGDFSRSCHLSFARQSAASTSSPPMSQERPAPPERQTSAASPHVNVWQAWNRVLGARCRSPFSGSLLSVQAQLAAPCGQVRGYAKRAKKWSGVPWRWVNTENVAEGAPMPASQPNAGSVKNRKRRRRMLQRALAAKKQVKDQIELQKAANAARDVARVKRWREGAERAAALWQTSGGAAEVAAGGAAAAAVYVGARQKRRMRRLQGSVAEASL